MITRRNLFAWATALGAGTLAIAASEPAAAQPFPRDDEERRPGPPPRFHRRPPPPPPPPPRRRRFERRLPPPLEDRR